MLTITLELFISIIALIFAVVGWGYGLLCQRSLNRQKNNYDEKICQLEKQLAIVTSGSIGIGQRIVSLEQRLRGLQEKQSDYSQNDQDFSFVQAQKLIEQGVDVKTVAANSGLSPSEVNLMQLMYEQAAKH